VEDPLVDSEIFHSGEGGDVERWLKPRNKFTVFAISCLLFSIAFKLLILVWLLLLHIIIDFISFITLIIGLYSSQQEGN